MHRHPDFWPDPDAFLPERFEKADDERPKLTYVPFSAGPHHCIGEALSFFEMLAHLNRFARRFRLRRVDSTPIRLEAAINLRSIEPFIMRLERRQQGTSAP